VIADSEWSTEVRGDRGGPEREAYVQSVRWNFIGTLGIPPVSGRTLREDDSAGKPRVAVINATMARQFFGDPSANRREIRLVRANGNATVRSEVGKTIEVVN
jgi:hypothetical protein